MKKRTTIDQPRRKEFVKLDDTFWRRLKATPRIFSSKYRTKEELREQINKAYDQISEERIYSSDLERKLESAESRTKWLEEDLEHSRKKLQRNTTLTKSKVEALQEELQKYEKPFQEDRLTLDDYMNHSFNKTNYDLTAEERIKSLFKSQTTIIGALSLTKKQQEELLEKEKDLQRLEESALKSLTSLNEVITYLEENNVKVLTVSLEKEEERYVYEIISEKDPLFARKMYEDFKRKGEKIIFNSFAAYCKVEQYAEDILPSMIIKKNGNDFEINVQEGNVYGTSIAINKGARNTIMPCFIRSEKELDATFFSRKYEFIDLTDILAPSIRYKVKKQRGN